MSKAEQTKEKILNAAEELFVRKGYDTSSVEDIMYLTGISKGGLYYHFKSKEEIMDAVIERFIQKGVIEAKKVVTQKEYPVITRMAMLFGAMNVRDASSEEILKQIHRPQNALLHQKSLTLSTKLFVPFLADLIEEGVREGIFYTEYPRENAMTLFVSAQFLFDEQLFPMTPEEQLKMVKAFLCMAERTVGAAPGSSDALLNIFNQ